MSTAQSTNRFPAAAGNKRPMRADCSPGLDALRIRIIREDIGNSGRLLKCGNFSTGRLSSRTGNARFVTKSSQITTTSCQITEIRKGWEERGRMITQTISKQRISGAMKKRDRPEWMIEPCACAFCGPEKKVNRVVTYGRSVGRFFVR